MELAFMNLNSQYNNCVCIVNPGLILKIQGIVNYSCMVISDNNIVQLGLRVIT